MDKEELYGEDRLAAETRIRNLLWTVSGDYDLSCELDIDSFQKAKEISLYDAIKQGAFARFFDTEAFGLYLVKKIYLGAEEGQLMGIAQLCLDEASFSKVAAERPGVPDIRKRAFEEILERDFGRLNASFAGRLKLAYLRRALTGDPAGEQKLRRELDRVEALKDTNDTLEIIRCVDGIYNSAVDRKFEQEQGLWRGAGSFHGRSEEIRLAGLSEGRGRRGPAGGIFKADAESAYQSFGKGGAGKGKNQGRSGAPG